MEGYKQVGNVLKLENDNVVSLKSYKNAKTLVVHLKAILQVVTLAIKGLQHFEIYVPVHEMLQSLRSNKLLLEAHLRKQEQILNKGGKKNV